MVLFPTSVPSICENEVTCWWTVKLLLRRAEALPSQPVTCDSVLLKALLVRDTGICFVIHMDFLISTFVLHWWLHKHFYAFSSSSSSSNPTFYGVDVWWYTPPCRSLVPFSLTFTSLWYLLLGLSSFVLVLPLPSLSFLRSALLFSSHAQATLPPFLDFEIPPTFFVPLILSFLILSSFVTPHIHHTTRISVTSTFFSCSFFNAHVSSPYTSAGLTTLLRLSLDLNVHFSVTQHSRHSSNFPHFDIYVSIIWWFFFRNVFIHLASFICA